MNDAKYYRQKIAEVDRQISELQRYKRFLSELSRDTKLLNDRNQRELITAKNAGKFATLRSVIELLAHGRPKQTKEILRFLSKSLNDRRNERTLRSHLTRLKNEGHLVCDDQSGLWTLPKRNSIPFQPGSS